MKNNLLKKTFLLVTYFWSEDILFDLGYYLGSAEGPLELGNLSQVTKPDFDEFLSRFLIRLLIGWRAWGTSMTSLRLSQSAAEVDSLGPSTRF